MDERGTELGKAIEGLYHTFSTYRPPRDMDVCSHCWDVREIRKLCEKPLRELTSDELSSYVFDAMTTAGDASDFRYFLPRILELLPEDLCGDWGPEVVLGKLGYGKWTSWPNEERQAIGHFLRELWRWARRAPLETASVFGWEMDGWLCGVARTGEDLGLYLVDWKSDASAEAQINLARFIELASQISPDAYWEDLNLQLRQLQGWAADHSR